MLKFRLPKTLLLSLLLPALLVTRPATAQALPPDTLVCDRFADNEQGWFVGEAETRTATLGPTEGYHLRYTGAAPAGGAPATAVFALHDVEDYLIEATVRLRGVGGLLLGYSTGGNELGGNDYRIFTIQPTRVQVLHYVGGSAGLATEIDEPLPPGFDHAAPHRLALARTGAALRFRLDGQPVGAALSAPAAWPGPQHNLGFFVQNAGAELWCSQWLIRHYSAIRLTAGVPRILRRERLANLSTASTMDGLDGVSANGQWLYFGRRSLTENAPGDVYRAERQADGSFGPAEKLPSPVNSPLPDEVASVSPDGQTLVVVGTYDPATGEKNNVTDLAQTSWQPGGGWSRPTLYAANLTLPGGKFISHFVDASGTVALVGGDAAAHPDNKELYVSLRRPDGTWGPLRALGPTLNTPGDEYAPFLAPDGRTLYFASDGHPGYGNLDIFVSTRLDDSWNRWSPPLNLGPGVNTKRLDCYFQLPAQGAFAYLSSTEPGAADSDYDLYRLTLPPALRPAPTVLVRGRVLDARTNQPVPGAALRYETLPAGIEAGRLQLSGSGSYEIALPAGRSYGFGAAAAGYLAASNYLNLSASESINAATTAREVVQDLYLLPLAEAVAGLPAVAVRLLAAAPVPAAAPVLLPGIAAPSSVSAPVPKASANPSSDALAAAPRLVLHNLFFVRGLPRLLPASFPELNRLVATLAQNPTLRIRLDGHTDNTGDAKDPRPNQLLSEQRAAAVSAYLVAHGIAPVRLSIKGYGGQQPVAPNDTEAHKAQNRRVELVVANREG